MLRLATVFSGIGAIEHALERMNVKHRIVFACDNGDVDILNKKVGMNIDAIREEIIILKTTIQDLQIDESVEDLYKKQLYGMFKEASKEQSQIFDILTNLEYSPKLMMDMIGSKKEELIVTVIQQYLTN